MASTSESEVFCANASVEVGEPLAGTAAAETTHWIALEQSSAWGPKGVEDSGLPPELVSYLNGLGKQCPQLRVQLIRRHEGQGASRDSSGPEIKLFLARTDETVGRLYAIRLAELAALPGLGLEAWLRDGSVPEVAQELSEPLYLVCAHGKRDRCCALRGMPLYTALRELAPGQVWQTTHLGGHRFAATMVVLPHGICYGRLSEHDAEGLHAAHQARELYALGKVRGRTCYSGAAQAAEVLLRERLSERRLEGLELAGVESTATGQLVRFKRASEEHLVNLERVALPPAPASCGAKPKAGEGFVPLGSLLVAGEPARFERA